MCSIAPHLANENAQISVTVCEPNDQIYLVKQLRYITILDRTMTDKLDCKLR